MEGKKRPKIFYNHNNVEKKTILKNVRNIFLYSQECCEQKSGVKKSAKFFLKILTNMGSKRMAGKKSAIIF